ncbi:MAG: hypothetical protein LH466_03235 [Sphingomonas bacterium]|nr:hypothetical protein [Sphingomonas bacterium]
MSALVKVLTGAAGLAAVVGFATPAAAQYYPGTGYGYNNGGGVVGAIINSVIGGGGAYGGGYGGGYGNNGGNDRYAVDQCSRAVQSRLGGGYGGYGYNNYGGGRVVGITRVERRNSGIRVRGVASSGSSSGYGGYGYNNASADLSFSCKVDYRGRIVDLDLDRRYDSYGYNEGYRGY